MKLLLIFFSLNFLFACFLRAHAALTAEIQSVPVTLAFETLVESPNHLTICGGKLWTFSESLQQLVAIDLKKGSIISQSAIEGTEPIDISALACKENRLLVAVNTHPRGYVLEIDPSGEKNRIVAKHLFPSTSRGVDFFCNQNQCWLLQDKIWKTSNLDRWSPVGVPLPPQLKKAHSRAETDPFEDWQSSLSLAKGQYTRGAIDKNGQVVLMDPFHAQVAIRVADEWKKWGSFGAWEGSFLSPKAMNFITDDTLAIADSKLKAVFLYRRDGLYLGVLAWGPSLIFSPDYPLGLIAQDNRVFVADFRGNKIFAVDLKKYNSHFQNAEEIRIRQNLFRREEVLKDQPSSLCLNCHDGTVSNQLHKFVKRSFHHPLECSQCHEPHHLSKNRHYLKVSPAGLCLDCHKDYAKPETNHVGFANHKKGGSCLDCHQSHADIPKLLTHTTPELCIECHKNQTFKHKSVEDLTILQKAKEVRLDQGKIDCLTCHQTHINWKESHFVKDPTKIVPFCSSCHGDKAPNLFKKFHNLKKAH